MNITVEEVATCRKKINVELTAEEVNGLFDEAYAEVKRQAQVPGFRKGHAPRRVLERKFGKGIAEDVRGRLFNKGFEEALQQEELAPLGDPDVKLDELKAAMGESFAFSTEVDVRPKFELKDYKDLELTEKIVPVTDEDLDSRMSSLQYNFAEHTEKDGAAEEGDLVEGDVTLTCGDEEIFKQEDRSVKLEGTAIFGMEVGDVVGHLKGSRKDDTKTVSFTVADDYPREDIRGKDAVITIAVKKVLKVELPELDDAFVQRLGMDSIEKLREHFKTSMENERKGEARRRLEEALTDVLVDAYDFDLPEGIIERQTQASLMQQRFNMMRMGATQEALKDQEAGMEEEAKKTAVIQIKRMLIIDAIGDKEELTVSESDIQQHIGMLATNYGTTPDNLMKDIAKRNGFGQLYSEIRDIKVTQFLLDNAKITTKEVAEDELDN